MIDASHHFKLLVEVLVEEGRRNGFGNLHQVQVLDVNLSEEQLLKIDQLPLSQKLLGALEVHLILIEADWLAGVSMPSFHSQAFPPALLLVRQVDE